MPAPSQPLPATVPQEIPRSILVKLRETALDAFLEAPATQAELAQYPERRHPEVLDALRTGFLKQTPVKTSAEYLAWLTSLPPDQQESRVKWLRYYIGNPSFYEFALATYPYPMYDWQARHLCPIIQRLYTDRLMTGQGVRILVHSYPQSGKSTLLSQLGSAWLLGVDPNHRLAIACYNESHAQDRFGKTVMGLMKTPAYGKLFPSKDARIPKVCSAAEFSTQKRRLVLDGQPSFKALGLSVGFTGLGVDTLICDDPYASGEDVRSDAIRERVYRFWSETAKPRVGKSANVIVMYHRYQNNDLAGMLLQEEGWEEIRFPGLGDLNEDGTDPTNRAIDEPLAPSHRCQEELFKMRREDPRMFAALYQGRPRLDEGNLFKSQWFRYYEDCGDHYALRIPIGAGEHKLRRVRKNSCSRIITADFATSEKTAADPCVFAVWDLTPQKEALLVERVREREQGPEVKGIFRSLFQRWRPSVVVVGMNGLDIPLVQDLTREGYPIRGVKASTDKYMRATAQANRYELGMVYHPAPPAAPWLQGNGEAWEDEHLTFPNATHDDQVDCGSLCALMIQPESIVFPEFGRHLHVAEQPFNFPPDGPLEELRDFVIGWAFEPYPCCVVTQLGSDGVWRLLRAYVAQRESLPEFVQRVANELNSGLHKLQQGGLGITGLRWRNVAPPGHCGVSGQRAAAHADAYLTIANGVQQFGNRNLDPIDADDNRFEGWFLTPALMTSEAQIALVRDKLKGRTGNRERLQIDPQCDLLIELFEGGASWQATNTGFSSDRLEPNKYAGLVTALGAAVSVLAVGGDLYRGEMAGPGGTARGTGRRGQ